MQSNYRQDDQEVLITFQDGDGVLVYRDHERQVRWEAVILASGSYFVLRKHGGWNDTDLSVIHSAIVKLARKLQPDLSVETVHVAYLPAVN